jgi:Fe-S cluster biosynthesis and repair protein YggX
MEFMGQLCAPMVDAPQEIYQYVEAEMWDRLHRTVTMLLADREIADLESLDAALLEILRLDELRADMEEMRDSLVSGLVSNGNQ